MQVKIINDIQKCKQKNKNNYIAVSDGFRRIPSDSVDSVIKKERNKGIKKDVFTIRILYKEKIQVFFFGYFLLMKPYFLTQFSNLVYFPHRLDSRL